MKLKKLYASLLVVLSMTMLMVVAGLNANALPMGCSVSPLFGSQGTFSRMDPYITAQKQGELKIGNLWLTFFKTPSNDYMQIIFQDEKSSTTIEVFSSRMVNGGFYSEYLLDGVFVFGIKSEFNPIGPLNNQGKAPQVESITTFGNKWWDGLYFSIPNGVKYYHPNKGWYGIQPWHTFARTGTDLLHYMFDDATSEFLASVGFLALSTAIGAAIGTLINPGWGTVFGAVVGAVLGAFLMWGSAVFWLDEDNNMWWWQSIALLNWLTAYGPWIMFLYAINPSGAINMVMSAFFSYGYLQVGSAYYVDFIGKGPVGWY